MTKLQKRLQDLIKQGLVICAGDNLLIEQQKQAAVIFSFAKIRDKENIHLIDPTGVVIEESQEFYDFTQTFAKKRYLEFVEKTLTNLEAVSKIKQS